MSYGNYYQTENLFGEPYPELIEFFAEYSKGGKVLDLGCGQGRDAIALARLGYSVTGIDNSKVGINQMNQIAKSENLNLRGKEGDVYAFDGFQDYDIVLLDSMFHFEKKGKQKEIGLILKIVANIRKGGLIVVCIQNTGTKVQLLKQALSTRAGLEELVDKSFTYIFEDRQSGHRSETDYRMIIVKG